MTKRNKKINRLLFQDDDEEGEFVPASKLFETEALENDEDEDCSPSLKKKIKKQTTAEEEATTNNKVKPGPKQTLLSMGFTKKIGAVMTTNTTTATTTSVPLSHLEEVGPDDEEIKAQDKKEIEAEEKAAKEQGEEEEVDSQGNLVDPLFFVPEDEEEEEEENPDELLDHPKPKSIKIKKKKSLPILLQWPPITSREKEVIMDFVIEFTVPKNISIEFGVIDDPVCGLPLHFYYKAGSEVRRLYTVVQFPITEIKLEQVCTLKNVYYQFYANPMLNEHELWLVCIGNHRVADQAYQDQASHVMIAWLAREISELKVVVAYMAEKEEKKRVTYFG